MRFKKKPETVSAERLSHGNLDAVFHMLMNRHKGPPAKKLFGVFTCDEIGAAPPVKRKPDDPPLPCRLMVFYDDDGHKDFIDDGDWVVVDDKGTISSCKPEVFAAAYEAD